MQRLFNSLKGGMFSEPACQEASAVHMKVDYKNEALSHLRVLAAMAMFVFQLFC